MSRTGRYMLGSRAVLLSLVLAACSRTEQAVSDDASPSGATSAKVASTDAGATAAEPPRERTPKELLESHRRTLTVLIEQEKYSEVCKGTPWFNQAVCNWAAARASGKAVERPDGELFRAFFNKEHWKHVNGTIISDPTESGDYIEVSVGGYRNHCVLSPVDTKFSSRGRFDMWVQEQPKTHEVALNSGATANWVVLEESPLAKQLMGIAKSGVGIESTAMAKDAMKMIAEYETYSERNGETPSVPGTTAAAAASGAGRATVAVASGVITQPAATPATVVPKAASPVKGTTEAPPQPVPVDRPAGPGVARGDGAPFDRGAAQGALGGVNVQSCMKTDGPTGMGHVKVTFAPDGSASAVTLDLGPFAGTAVGTCIEARYRNAHVPPFAGSPVTVGKSFTIN